MTTPKTRSIASMTFLACIFPIHYFFVGRKDVGIIFWSANIASAVVDTVMEAYGGNFVPVPLLVWWIMEAVRTPHNTRAWNAAIDPANHAVLPLLKSGP